MARKRSPLFYVGDKFRLLDQLLPLFPTDIKTYYEPFLGGGSVAMNVSADSYLLSDQLPQLMEIHQKLSEYSSHEDLIAEIRGLVNFYELKASFFGDTVDLDLKKSFPKTYFAVRNRDAYMALRRSYNASEDKDPLILYLLIVFGFNRLIRFNSKGEFNVPVGNVDFNSKTASSLLDYINWSNETKPQFHLGDYRKLAGMDVTSGDFVYVDPPYLIAEAEYNKSWGLEQEKELLDFLDGLHSKGVRWALSNALAYRGRENVELKKWSQSYNTYNLKASYLNYHNNLDKDSGEVVVTNYV